MRLGPVLEIIINGKYFWMPFNAIDTLKIDDPVDLRDSVWTAATVKLRNGGECVGLIPTRYPGSGADPDGAVRLSRSTLWADAGAETFVGSGQRLLATDQGDLALMDVRLIKMDALPGQVDKASPVLMKYCSNGDHFDSAKLIVRKAGKTPLEYIVIEMTKVMVTSVSTGGSGGEDKLTENISLNFSDVKVTYVPQMDDGTGDADIIYNWDIAGNVEK